MSKAAKIKKEPTLIESVIAHSKEIIGLKQTKRAFVEALGRAARQRFRPIDLDSIRSIIKEYDLKIDEARQHCGTLMRGAYSKDYAVLGSRWHLSKMDMAAGWCWITIAGDRECILFLSKNEDAFLDTINPGEIHEYESVKDRLCHSESVWNRGSVNELLLQKYQEIEN